MKRCAVLAFLLVLSVPASVALGGEDASEAGRLRRAVAMARDRVYPALVNISTVTQRFRGGRAVRFLAAGSGVIVSPAGHVLTNFHVAENATRLSCGLPSGERIDADVIAHDPLTDLSVLKLRLHEREDPTLPIPFAAIGDSADLQVGDRVLAMGNPRTLSSSMTLGIVANTNRVFKSFTGNSIQNLELSEGQPTGLFTRWIQHDALIQPGNSGGPLVNLEGEVVGINELGGGGMGFAIPSNLAKEVLNRALTFGEIRRGWLGVTVHPVEPLDRMDGALVASVLGDGPAAAAGLEPGDVILSVGRLPMAVRRFEDVPSFYADVANLPIGRSQKVVYLRDGERHEVDATVTRMEDFLGEERLFPTWGVTAMSITGPMAFARHYPDTSGVVITSIRPGKAPEVARPALRSRDVVIGIAGEPVTDFETFEALQKKHRRSKALLVRFRRGRRDMVTVFDMTKKPPRPRRTELAKAWLGVQVQVLTPEVAKALGLEGRKGYRVAWVLPETEAEKAGLETGDVITALDGEALEAWRLQDAELLRRRIEDMDIASDVTLSVLRNGEEMSIDVTLEETPETAVDTKKAKDEVLEYQVREVTYMDRVDNHWPSDIEGLMVADVVNGGWANVAGLQVDDLLLSIEGEDVHTIAAFKKMVERIAKEKPRRVEFFVRRDRSTRFVFVEPEWPRD